MQNQIDQGLLQEHEQNNVEGMENEYVDKHKQPTQIFEMGKEYFKQCHQLLAIYTALKFIAAITLIILRETIYGDEILQKNYHEIFNDAYLVFWMYISCTHSLFAFIYYIQLLMKIDNEVKCTQVVEEIGQMIVIEIPEGYTNQEREAFINEQVQIQNQEMIQRLEIDGQIEESRRISLIATEIKKTLLQNERPLNVLGKGCFILFQFIQLWGLIFYFHKKSSTESNEDLKFYSLYKGYLFSVVFMGIYQYLEIYIITLLVLIFLPILLFYSLYDWIKNYCQKRRERRRIDDSLKESMYSLQETAEGENECAICMNQYEEKDKIAILPCSNKHRFHSTCVRSWLEINSKCPLCRSDVQMIKFNYPPYLHCQMKFSDLFQQCNSHFYCHSIQQGLFTNRQLLCSVIYKSNQEYIIIDKKYYYFKLSQRMINLNEEQKIQQNKLVNIFGQHAKQAVIIFIMNALLRVQENDTFFMSITLYLTIIMFLFNCVAAVFLLCFKREFPKIEYFLIYTMNVFMFIILLVYSLNYFIQKKEQDHLLQLYIKTYIMILLGKEIEILIIKIFPIELTNRSVNCFTSCIIGMMILSHGDNYECQNKYSMVLLSLLLSNILTSIFNIIFTLILFNQNRSQKELRNFADLLLTVLFLVHLAQYVLVFIKTNAIIEEECQCLSFIFQFQKYVAPINFISFLFVIYQEVCYFKEAIKYQELIEKNTQHNNMYSGGIQNQQPFKQGVRHSMKSLSSVVNPMEASQSNSQAPNFGTYDISVNQSDNQGQKLEKMGTSQFGASQHNQGMQHSWANVQNPNPFGTIVKEQQDSIENQKRGSKSVDESLIRQEESQIPENLSQVNNPMESGSVVTIH